ncbi:MAG: ABC transporter substrate-binding protein [Deltaproteobacteria bacterium]|nr:ABC transporter substrate-binding protein [Deltaproteobacteria bacterium]
MKNYFFRRNFLRMSLWGALCVGLVCGPLWGGVAVAAEPVTILAALPFSGPYAKSGMLMERGVKMAIEHAGGQVLGRPIRLITRDTQTKSGVAIRRVEEAIEKEKGKISAIIGPWSSGVALAVSEVARRRKVLHYFSGGTEDIAGKKCHRYSFQWAAHAYTAAHAIIDGVMKRYPDAKRWYTITVNYAFGWSVRDNFHLVGKDYGIQFVGDALQPLGEREFSPYMSKIKALKPDTICLINFGLDAIQSVRSAFNFGFTKTSRVIMSWSSGPEELEELTPEMREGVYLGSNFYYTVGTPVANRYVNDYRKKYKVVPGYAPSAAYAMTRIVLLAIEKAGSSDPEKIIDTLEGFTYEGFYGRTRILAANHQTERPYLLLRAKSKNEMKHSEDYAEILAMVKKQYPGDRGCKTDGGRPLP